MNRRPIRKSGPCGRGRPNLTSSNAPREAHVDSKDDTLETSQYCGARDCTILDAVAGKSDVLPCAEIRKQAECLLSLDFSAAFDSVPHECLFCVLRQYGLYEVSFTSKPSTTTRHLAVSLTVTYRLRF